MSSVPNHVVKYVNTIMHSYHIAYIVPDLSVNRIAVKPRVLGRFLRESTLGCLPFATRDQMVDGST